MRPLCRDDLHPAVPRELVVARAEDLGVGAAQPGNLQKNANKFSTVFRTREKQHLQQRGFSDPVRISPRFSPPASLLGWLDR